MGNAFLSAKKGSADLLILALVNERPLSPTDVPSMLAAGALLVLTAMAACIPPPCAPCVSIPSTA